MGPESFVIEIEPQKVAVLLNEFRNDASLLASHLKIMNNRMVLLNPRFQGAQKSGDTDSQKNEEGSPEKDNNQEKDDAESKQEDDNWRDE